MTHGIFSCIANEEDVLTVHSYIRLRKNKLYKNLIFLSLSQSSMYIMYKTMMLIREYEHDFLGIWSYTMFNASKIFGFLFLPTLVLSYLKLQKTVRCGMILNSLIILLHYMKWVETVTPVAICIGLLAATTLVCQQTHVYRLAKIMSKVSGDDLETVLLRFSGMFFSIYRAYEIPCYLPTAFVSPSYVYSNDSKLHCGTRFYFDDYTSLSNFTLPPRNERSCIANITVIVLAFCALLLSTVLIDPPHKLTATHLGIEKYHRGIATIIRLFKRRRLQLMIPMSIFAGYEKMIKAYDYTTAYVDCVESAACQMSLSLTPLVDVTSLLPMLLVAELTHLILILAYVGCVESAPRAIDVHFLGCLAACQMPLSLTPLVDVTSLQAMLLVAALTHLILILVLLLNDHIGLIGYYIISATWGLASSTWDCLLYVLYGMLSPGEELESYCHLGLWYSVGTFTNLLLTRFVSVSFKLWTAFVCLLLATTSALILPYIINYIPKKIEPLNGDTAGKSGTSETAGQGLTDKHRKTGVYFGITSATRDYNPPEVKSISTSKIHHVAIPKTRPRFERHEYSAEDIPTLF